MDNQVRWYAPTEKARDAEEDKKLRAAHLLDTTRDIEQRQSAWHELNLWNSTLYTNRELPGFRWGQVEAETELWPTNLRTENLVESIGESMLSKASSSPLKPSLVPHGRSWKVERAVRLAGSFLVGVWRQTKAENACVEMFRDAFMSGLGCVRVEFDSKSKALHVRSVFFDQIIIDNRECANRQEPRTFRIREVLPREVVENRFDCKLSDKPRPYTNHRAMAEGWVAVVTAWRRPDSAGKGGYHMVACDDQILHEEEWNETWVPLEFFHWQDRTSGFFVKSGVEQLVPYQVRQNDLNDDARAATDLVCRPRLLMNANSMMDVNQWDNEFGRILLWSGNKPEPFEWKGSQLDVIFGQLEANKAAAYSHMGMSEAFANADLPQQVRLDSSAGVREFRNMEDSRHLRLWNNFEAARLGVARKTMLVLGRSKDAAAFTTTYHPAGSRARAKEIPYKALKTLKDDQFSWTLEAVPLSEMSPAARHEIIRDRASRGMVPPGGQENMAANPNLELLSELEMASVDDIRRHLEIVEEGGFEAPTELTNCTEGVRMFTANYHRLKDYEDVEPGVLENHIRWIVKATAITQSAVTPTPPVPFAPTQGMPGTNATTIPSMPPPGM